MNTTTTSITDAGPDTAVAFGFQLQRGYVYQVTADDHTRDCSVLMGTDSDGREHWEPRAYGYHGNDVPPCGAHYLYGSDDGDTLYVISDESDPADIPTVDGFTLSPFRLDEGDKSHDGTWGFLVLSAEKDGLTTIAGRC